MATKEMTIKLMVDTESNRLIFAEASKDFVDFLIFLLSLPIGTVIKLLTSESMVGSIGNVYSSFAKLDETYLRSNVDKNAILNPAVFSPVANVPLSATNSSRQFYTCCDPECKRGITNVVNGANCPGCDGILNQEMEFIDNDSEGYVQNIVSYMISDDLAITSVSSLSIVSMMNKFNAYKLEERKVNLGSKEALELLKASFQSKTVLTDVFLRAKMDEGQDQYRMSNDPNMNQEQDISEGQSTSQPPRLDNTYLSPQAPFIPSRPMHQWLSTPLMHHSNPCALFSSPTPLQDPPYHHQNVHPPQPASYQPPPLPQPPPLHPSSVGKKKWTSKEDLQLCRAWVKVFGGKRKDNMGERVKDTFHELMKEAYGEECIRNLSACSNRMSDLKALCSKWADIRTRIFQKDLDSANLELLALETWEEENDGKPFRHMACFNVLKECPKWNEVMKMHSVKSMVSMSQPCVGGPSEPLDTPVPEFAPVHTASNKDKSQTPVVPKTEKDSPYCTIDLTEKGATCAPVLNGPAFPDTDSPPSPKRAKDQYRMSNDPNMNQEQDVSEGQSTSQPPRLDNTYLSPQAPVIPTRQMHQWLSTPPSNLHPNPCALFSSPTPFLDPLYHHQHFNNQQNVHPPQLATYQPPPPPPPLPLRPSSVGKKKWTSNEDLQLCRAWVKIFGEKRKGNICERIKDTFYELMKEAYGEECTRNVGSCNNRMSELKAICSKWADILTRTFQNNLDSANLELLALETWEDENDGKPFRHMACWNVLKECPKWNEVMKMHTVKSMVSMSQPCVGVPSEPMDTPLPEFAPVCIASNRDKSQTPIVPKTEKDSPDCSIIDLTEKGTTCAPVLNGPASTYTDSPPSQKRAKGQNGWIQQQLSDG